MASLWKRRENPVYWIACFTSTEGKQLKRSTGIRVTPLAGDPRKAPDLKREAMAIAQEYESAVRSQRTNRQTHRVLLDLHERTTGTTLPKRTTREAMESWLAAKAPEITKTTQTFYRNSADKFLAHLGPMADQDVMRLTRDAITSYRNAQAAHLSVASVNHDLGVVRSFCKHARREGWLMENPSEFVDKLKQRKGSRLERTAYQPEEIQRILAACDGEWRSMVIFGLYTGQRLGDLRQLKWSSIDLSAGAISLTTSKTTRSIQIPIVEPLRRHIETLSRTSDFVHPRLAVAAPNTPSNQFAKILAKAGLRDAAQHRPSHGKGRGAAKTLNPLSFHSLRHTTVTMLKEAGVPAAVVMEIVGHSSAAISQMYTHIGMTVLADGMSKLPDLTSLQSPPSPEHSQPA